MPRPILNHLYYSFLSCLSACLIFSSEKYPVCLHGKETSEVALPVMRSLHGLFVSMTNGLEI